MSFVLANNNLGETVSVSECYNNPYDAYQNRHPKKKELCLVADNRVICILDTKMISVKWAVACAKHVLHIFEEQYPSNKRPRKAIEAASNWIKDPSEQNKKACKDASNDVDLYYNNLQVAIANPMCWVYAMYAASYTADAVFVFTAFATSVAVMAALYASLATPNKSLEIKWQRQKLNQIVYEEILIAFVKSQYQRIDSKLVRKIPKELLEYIASFITG